MSDLTVLAQPAFAADPASGDRAPLERLEQAVADTLVQVEPGQENTSSVQDAMQRLALTNQVLLELGPTTSASTLTEVVGRIRTSSVIDEALQKSAQAHAQALAKAGVSSVVLELLQSWVQLTVDARIVQRQIELRRAIDSASLEASRQTPELDERNPVEPLSAAQLGSALGGLSDETVRQRERAGELFSILRPGRKRGREYPAFQAWPGIAGEPLASTLVVLGAENGTLAYGFFTSPTDLLGGLTPIEALLGRLTAGRSIDPGAHALLAAPAQERLRAVLETARAEAAILVA